VLPLAIQASWLIFLIPPFRSAIYAIVLAFVILPLLTLSAASRTIALTAKLIAHYLLPPHPFKRISWRFCLRR
jgi:hypothetical protein